MSITLVQQGGAMDNTNPFAPAVTLGTNVTSGSCLVAVCFAVATDASFSVADNRSNTWARAIQFGVGSGFLEIWRCLSAAAGSTTVTGTLTTSAGNDSCLMVSEWTFSVGKTAGTTNSKTNTSTTAIGTGAITPSAETLLIGCMTSPGGSPSLDGGNGFTEFTQQTGAYYYRGAYKVASSASQEATWTLTSAQTIPGAIMSIVNTGGTNATVDMDTSNVLASATAAGLVPVIDTRPRINISVGS